MSAAEQTVTSDIEWLQQSPSIVIDPEFKDLIFPLTPEELDLLEKSLLAEGCRDSLKVRNNNGILELLDGHHRHALCTKHNIPFTVDIIDLLTREDALKWIINNQLGRRNTPEKQKSYLRGKRLILEKQDKENNLKQNLSKHQSDASVGKTSAKIAGETGVSQATIERDAEFADAVDEVRKVDSKFAEKVLSDEVKISKKDFLELAKKPDAERKELIVAARALNEEAYGKLVKEPPHVRDAIVCEL